MTRRLTVPRSSDSSTARLEGHDPADPGLQPAASRAAAPTSERSPVPAAEPFEARPAEPPGSSVRVGRWQGLPRALLAQTLGPVILAAVLACEGTALGQDPPAPLAASAAVPAAPTVGEATISRWYGWQTLIVDALPLGLFTYAGRGSLRNDRAWLALAVVYSFSGSSVHVAHENYGRAGLALATRAAGAFLTMSLLLHLDCIEAHEDGPGGPGSCHGAAAVLPMAGSTAVDAGLIAHERVPVPQQSALWLAPMGRGLAVGGTW
jgi:hypothetical protein